MDRDSNVALRVHVHVVHLLGQPAKHLDNAVARSLGLAVDAGATVGQDDVAFFVEACHFTHDALPDDGFSSWVVLRLHDVAEEVGVDAEDGRLAIRAVRRVRALEG